jgi:uncharacterized SAM-binding protein YcdF (DUF218 family)
MRRVVLVAGALLLAAWVASLAAVVAGARTDRAGPADAIVVLGAAQYNGQPSPVFRARLEHARALWDRGLAPLVVVTGGVGTRDTLSEAEVARRYLTARGLPDSVLAVEATGRKSEPSVRAAARRVREAGGARIILVSDGFHMLRLAVLARRLGLVPLGSPAPESPIRRNARRELGYLLAESVKVPVAFLLTRS